MVRFGWPMIHFHREVIEHVRRVAVHVSSRARFGNWAGQGEKTTTTAPLLLVLVLVECLLRSASNLYQGEVGNPHARVGEPGARDVLRLDLMELPPLRAS